MTKPDIGIYCIENTINSKIYIGSSKHISKREAQHFSHLSNGNHHNIHLQRAVHKYGMNAFIFYVLEYCDIEQLFDKEKFWIDELQPEYNIGSVGGGDNLTKHPLREEIIERRRKTQQEKMDLLTYEEKQAKWARYGDSNPNWRGGISNPLCPICKINHMVSTASCCSGCRDRSGASNSFFGKTHSEETKQILSEKAKGRKSRNSRRVSDGQGNIYNSCTEAALALGLSPSTITVRCSRNTYGWHYVENLPETSKYIVDGVSYVSMSDIARALNIHVNTVHYRLHRKDSFKNWIILQTE